MKFIKTRRGSYTVEAAIVMPIFILAMIALVSVVLVFATGENMVFSMCDQHILADIEASAMEEGITLPVATLLRVKEENPGLSYALVTDYQYLHEEDGMTGLISMEISGSYKLANILLFPVGGEVSERVRSRAFTGLYKPTPEGDNLAEDDEPEIVYVFPMHGEKYHNRECPFLNPACQRVFLTEDVQNQFAPCSICKSQDAKEGESVYCFFKEGKVYHYGKCSMVDKYYVEIEKKDALAQCYMPCMTCGG